MIRFCLYGVFGWCAEIIWTAVSDLGGAVIAKRRIDPRLIGQTYLWMFPIYGMGGLLFELAHAVVTTWPWLARGLVYMLGCFAVEYASGRLIQRTTGKIPWDYSRSRWQVRGLIRLDYAPLWLVFGLVLEYVERLASTIAPVLHATL